MTTILLDRDRFYGSALARAISNRQAADDVAIIADSESLPRLLARDPHALVIIDEEAMEDPDMLHGLITSRPSAQFIVLVSALRSSTISYLIDGAEAVVLRAQALRTLSVVVSSVANGLCSVPPQLMRILLSHFQLGAQTEINEQRLERLSPRELEILMLLVNGRDPAQVAEDLDVSIHTVRSHLKRMFRKLEVHSSLGAVLVAVGAGIVPADIGQGADVS